MLVIGLSLSRSVARCSRNTHRTDELDGGGTADLVSSVCCQGEDLHNRGSVVQCGAAGTTCAKYCFMQQAGCFAESTADGDNMATPPRCARGIM